MVLGCDNYQNEFYHIIKPTPKENGKNKIYCGTKNVIVRKIYWNNLSRKSIRILIFFSPVTTKLSVHNTLIILNIAQLHSTLGGPLYSTYIVYSNKYLYCVYTDKLILVCYQKFCHTSLFIKINFSWVNKSFLTCMANNWIHHYFGDFYSINIAFSCFFNRKSQN